MKKILFIVCFALSTYLHAQTPGNALNFDGVNDMVVVSSTPVSFSNLATNSFTFEAWVNPSASAFQRIIFAQPSTTNFASMGTGAGNVIYFYVIAGGTTYSVATTGSIPQNQWTHVACRWTAGTLTPEVFFNGVLQPGAGGGGSSSGTNGLMVIGSRPGGAQYFNGSLDEVRVWDVARTNCQIQSNMNSEFTAPVPNLVAYYNFNQGIAGGNNAGLTTLIDINSAYNGTITNFGLNGATSNFIASSAVINNIGPSGVLTASSSATICANDTFLFGGNPLTNSGVYIDTLATTNGCDSIVTLTLTALPENTYSFSATSCNEYTFNSTLLTSTGIYYDTVPSVNGCDSMITLNLTINNTQNNTINISACDQYLFNSSLLTTSGTYYDTLLSVTGCDSIVELNLTINTASANVNQFGTLLVSTVSAASFQWLDCLNSFAPISGATDSTFIATFNSSYALQITTPSGCIDTSSCFIVNSIGLDEIELPLLSIYPNPTDGFIQVKMIGDYTLHEHIELLNINGQVIKSVRVTSPMINIDLSEYPSGIYLIRLGSGGKIYKVIRN